MFQLLRDAMQQQLETDPADSELCPLKETTTEKTTFIDHIAARLGVDVRAAVALQSVLALMVLWFVATFAFDKADWFNSGPSSFIDPADPDFGPPGNSGWVSQFFFSRSTAAITSAQLILAVGLSVCVLSRIWPRLCLFVLLLLVISLHGKSHYVQDCGGRLLRHMLFWTCLLPTSVAPNARASKVVSGIAAFGVQFQLLYLYWVVVSRRQGKDWMGPDFSAVYYAISGPDYALPLGLFVSQILPGFCRLLTKVTVIIEIFCPVAPLLIPVHSWWRAVPAFGLMGLHAGIALTMNLRHFSVLAFAINVIYLPTPFWDVLSSLVGSSGMNLGFEGIRTCTPGRLALIRETIAAIALTYMVLHMDVFARLYQGTVWDDRGVLYRTSTLDEVWIMYSGSSKSGTYWDIRVKDPNSADEVDVLKWLRSGVWEVPLGNEAVPNKLPDCFSCLYPNMRWEYFLSKTADRASAEVRMLRLRAMTRWLCEKGSGGPGLARGSIVHFTNRLVRVNPPGSQLHFSDAGIRFEHRLSCVVEV